MKALLLIAHGSKNMDSNDEIHALTDSLRTLMAGFPDEQPDESPEKPVGKKFALVECAFLGLSAPDIITAIGNLVQAGATEITVLPYFLARGNHIDRDIPAEIATAQLRFPDITLHTVPHVGKAANMMDLLLGHLQHHALALVYSPDNKL